MNYIETERSRYPLVPGIWSTGMLAGFAGGAAEVAWIALYGGLSGGGAAEVARGVTDTLYPNLAATPQAVPLGVAIHMGLAIMLGLAVAVLLRSLYPRMQGTALESLAVIGILAAIWGMNFFVVLPVINPAFVELVPYSASLVSKLLFGIAAASVLRMCDRSEPR